MPPITDRNLVVGVIALRLQFITQDDLQAGINDWRHNPSSSLGEALVARGVLTSRQLNMLEPLANEHLSRFGDLPQQSLEALQGTSWVNHSLESTHSIVDAAQTTSLVPRRDHTIINQPSSEPGAALPSGRYRIVEFYKGGGLGEVYRAQDDQLGRTVALKQIKHKYVHDDSMRRRFVREAEINGRLEHPAIVPVYSLGKYDDGRPFYTMRFVAGEDLGSAIKRYHARQQNATQTGQQSLDLRQLLRRFVDVCNAIAYAHSRGVIHRDLKPSNVLLGDFGETFLIDWGLAKALGEAAADGPALGEDSALDSDDHTRAGSAVGTPSYMSPEQARGDTAAIGQSADIYGLGAILYEILTGRPPVRGTTMPDVLRQVTEGQIAPLTSVHSGVPRALAAICQKALSRLPADRYGLARELAADVDRWLADEPVTAYPDPVVERVSRAVRRNKTSVAAASVLLVSALVALGVINVIGHRQNVQLTAANAAAMKNLAQAEAENKRAELNLEDLATTAFALQFTAEGPLARMPGAEQPRKRMTEMLVHTMEAVLAQRPNDPGVQLKVAQAYRIHANLLRQFNEQQLAREFYDKSLALVGRLSALASATEPIQLQHAGTLRDQATVLSGGGDLEGSIRALAEASNILDEVRSKNAADPKHDRLAATIALDRAGPLADLGRYDEALECARQATTAFTKLVDSSSQEANDLSLLLLAMNQQAEMLRELARGEEGLPVLQDGLSRARQALASNPTPDLQHTLARLMLNVGQVPGTSEAERQAALKEATAVWVDLLKRFPQRAFYQRYLAKASVAQGNLEIELGRLDDAQDHFKRAREGLEKIVEQQPTAVAYREVLVEALLGMTQAASLRQEQDNARTYLEKAKTHVSELAGSAPAHKGLTGRIAAVESSLGLGRDKK